MPSNSCFPPDTDRLAFRAWKDDDLDCFAAICADPRVMQFVGDGGTWPRQRAGEFIRSAREMLAEYGYCQWPLIHKSDSRLMGYCGFVSTANTPEIGWRLAAEYWGRGLATEAARAVLKHGRETLGFRRTIATVQSANTASLRVIEKLGMTLVERFERNGRDVMLYATDTNGPDA